MSRRVATVAVVLLVSSMAAASERGTARPASAGGATCRHWISDASQSAAIEKARELVPRLWRGLRAPGLTLAVAVDGRVVWSAGCGYADVARRTAVRRGTRFRIGSVSKSLTSAALARLVADGRVDLEARIQRYVPTFPRKRYPISIRQLAAHTAGIRHYRSRAEVVNRRRFRSVRAALVLFARDPLLFRPGTRFSYSSYGWNLVGAAIEGASPRSYAAFLRSAVLEPLALSHTALDDTRGGRVGASRFYELRSDGRAAPAPRASLSDRWPSGGLVSSAEDLAVFGSAFAAGTLVRAKTRDEFVQPQRTADGKPTGYALGWEVRDSPVGRFVGHTGNVVGGSAVLLVHLRSGVALAVTTNLGSVTASHPPPPKPSTPDPPELILPFVAGD